MTAAGLLRLAITFGVLGVADDASSAARPNVVVIVADDLGYADLGCYGGEIETPNVDRLASQGLRFTQFRATPMCTTSRVALLAGMPFHQSGPPNYRRSAPLPAVMKAAGYRTLMVGKWHAGTPTPESPELFDRAFGFRGGMTDCYAGGDDWFLDDQPFHDFAGGFDATSAFAARAVGFMEEAVNKDEPFFLYAAFNAPHHPCQARRETVEKYRERYRQGYESIAGRRLERQASIGLPSGRVERAPLGAEVRHWEELPEHRRVVEADRMAAYAAAVDELDQGIGRVLGFLRESGLEENTLVVFLSDNGGDYNNGSLAGDEHQIPWEAGGNPSSSNGWASVKNAPFRYYKHACHEGALATPMIVRWPAGIERPAGSLVDEPCHITDLYPTILKATGATYPTEHAEHAVLPLSGSSLLGVLAGRVREPRGPIFEWFDQSRAWIDGDWKAAGLYDGPWQLFNLAEDRGETTDLAAREPQLLETMITAWESHAARFDIPDPGPLRGEQRGWGWHRLKMVCPGLVDLKPENSQVAPSSSVSLRLEFDGPIDFRGTEGKTIRLYEVSNEAVPVWSADPDATHPAQGGRVLSFDDVPRLEADRGYFLLWDRGWIKVGDKPVAPLNDGAFWWRFRTPPSDPVGEARP